MLAPIVDTPLGPQVTAGKHETLIDLPFTLRGTSHLESLATT